MKKVFTLLFLVALIPAIVFAQVIYPNRGGTGSSVAPGQDELLIGNGSTFDLKSLTAGENISIATTSNAITITASLTGGGLATTDIDTYAELDAIVADVTLTHNGLFDTEAELTALLSDVSNIYTNNDGDLHTQEEIMDFVGAMLTGTETLITVTYQDGTDDIDFVVNDDLSLYDNTTSAFLTTSPFGADIGVAELASADFGDFTCNGLSCTLDATYLTGNETITLSGDVTGSGATAITTALAASSVSDNEIDYTTVTLADFTNDASFITSADDTVSGTELDGVFNTTGLLRRTAAGTYSTITDASSNWNTAYGWGDHSTQGYLTTVDISANTNLAAGTGLTLTGDTLSNDLGTSIDTSEIDADTITHADIADSDQASTMCLSRIENPTAADDFESIWANKTANDFLLTEIWAESDQTVAFDLQVDDGTPADVNGTDITPAAGEAEDTTLSGDTTVAAGEELDLVITSVTNTPTWVSICWTGQWTD